MFIWLIIQQLLSYLCPILKKIYQLHTVKKTTSLIALTIIFLKIQAQQQSDSFKTNNFSIHAQTTIIQQFKPSFSVKYSGSNSLQTQQESKTSITSTLYAGAQLWQGASIFVNPEIAGGSGLSQALGVADATNGETFRIGDASPKIYLARLYYKQVFALSKQSNYQTSSSNQLAQLVPSKYVSITIGKIGIADYFDNNKYSHDPRTQFMCWALMSNGAWDYPANTRGYTPSIVAEYINPKHEWRYGFSLVPLTANGNGMNWNLAQANAQTLEYTHNYTIQQQQGAIKILGFYTTANMGNYNQSIALNPSNPSIIDTRKIGNTKYGIGINVQQSISNNLGGFLRASYNDGNNETWAFTEIDHSLSAGLCLTGTHWKRQNDVIGLAYVSSGISKAHAAYLQAGGYGFMLGDGNLNYAWEHLTELYYNAEIVKNHTYLTGAYQLLINPGYNHDRQGPVNVFSVRLHTII